ncbi:MAG: hypothetical protein ACFHVJ_06065 [Aestuariibacter sp.]
MRCLIVAACFYMLSAQAQQLPNADIYLFEVQSNENQEIQLSEPVALADSVYYENQPYFIDDERLVFTRDNGSNTDIWQWHNGTLTVLSETPESEYSPTPIPTYPSSLSMIRVEDDGTQRLWKRNGKGQFDLLFQDIKPVGYHVWRGNNVAMFILGEPHRLEVTRVGKEATQVIDQNIGRCLQKVPERRAISYTVADEQHVLKSYDFQAKKVSVLGTLPQGAQDYIWLSETHLLASAGEHLLVGQLGATIEWQALSVTLPKGALSRLALSPNKKRLALVVSP